LSVVTDSRIYEIDFGSWEGKARDQIVADDPEGWERWNADPTHVPAGGTGETGDAAASRFASFVADHMAGDDILLVVGHNTLNRLYIAHSLGMPLRNYRLIAQSNAGISILEPDAEPSWRQINGM
jgi:alpha-ribazole phosphatase/probable phosphoglycerate mutase